MKPKKNIFQIERKETKRKQMRLFYERMNKNQRVTRVVYIIREQLNEHKRKKKKKQ